MIHRHPKRLDELMALAHADPSGGRYYWRLRSEYIGRDIARALGVSEVEIRTKSQAWRRMSDLDDPVLP